MARLRDIPHVLHTVGWWTFLKRVYNQTYEDNLLVWAAALAYSWLFALFPFLIFCLSLVPLLPDALKPSEQRVLEAIDDVLVTGENLTEAGDEVTEEILSPDAEINDPAAGDETQDGTRPTTEPVGEMSQADVDPLADPVDVPLVEDATETAAPTTRATGRQPPAAISQTISDLVQQLIDRPPSGLLTASLLIALFTASGGMAMTMAGLDKCYDVAWEKMRPLWKSRPIAMLLTVIVAVLVLLTLVLLPIGEAVLAFLSNRNVGGVSLTWIAGWSRPLRWVLALLLLLTALGITYRWGPSVRTRMHLFSPGSLFAVAMWILTAYGFQIYIGFFGAADTYARTYGAVAGVAFLMLLFYLDALFLLIGAEINAEIDFIRLGIRSGDLPEEREVAPIPPYQLDEEDRELKAELEDRRSVDEHRDEDQQRS